jgi:sulfatase maturation enzyme AslB (radical SAM superfamily)
MIQTTGYYQLCCVATHRDDMYDDWEGEDYQKIRKHMIEEKELPDVCVSCKIKERHKQYALKYGFDDLYKRLGSPSLDIQTGTAWEVPISFDLRMNNLCNLSCRMCGPEASSQIVKEAKKHPELWPGEVPMREFNAQEIIDNAANIADLKLLGGETTVQPEAKAMLKKLIEVGNTNLKLHITTNGTNMNAEFYDMLKQFKDVIMVVSIDSWGKHHEYIRGPATHFPTIWKNLHKLSTLWPNKDNVTIQQTITILNIFDFWLLDKNNDSPYPIMSNLARWPKKYAPVNMPYKWKRRAIDLAKENDAYEKHKHIFEEMMKDGDVTHLKGMNKYTELMDNVRGQHLIDHFPTTYEMLEDIG